MGPAHVLHRFPDPFPAQELEEAHVGDLDVGDHGPAAVPGRGSHGETHQLGPQPGGPELGQNGQPVALPQPSLLQGVEPDRAPGDRPLQAEHVDGGGGVVAGVPIADPEQPLLVDEDRLPDLEVDQELLGPRHRLAPEGQGTAGERGQVSPGRER